MLPEEISIRPRTLQPLSNPVSTELLLQLILTSTEALFLAPVEHGISRLSLRLLRVWTNDLVVGSNTNALCHAATPAFEIVVAFIVLGVAQPVGIAIVGYVRKEDIAWTNERRLEMGFIIDRSRYTVRGSRNTYPCGGPIWPRRSLALRPQRGPRCAGRAWRPDWGVRRGEEVSKWGKGAGWLTRDVSCESRI